MSRGATVAHMPRDARDRRLAAGSAAGGALVAVGTALPWLTLFAGLHSYSGLTHGSYGRLLFAGGALAVAGGLAAFVRPASGRWLGPSIALLGALLVLFTTWLLIGLGSTTRALGSHPLLVMRPGPGLFVALAGALVVAASAGWPGRWLTSAACGRDDAQPLEHAFAPQDASDRTMPDPV